ncbi:Palmitoyltransferase, partial [Ascosphaera acerosa]
MDHHCPWTSNCVSYFTFPHFLRFLSYATTALAYAEHLVLVRVSEVWHDRALPS